MTSELERSGLGLLKSLVAERRVGRPGAAREQALAAAAVDAANAHVHLLDAAYAAADRNNYFTAANHGGIAMFAFADGSVHAVRATATIDVLHALMSTGTGNSGGELLLPDDY